MSENAIKFDRPLRAVSSIDPDAPLPPLPAEMMDSGQEGAPSEETSESEGRAVDEEEIRAAEKEVELARRKAMQLAAEYESKLQQLDVERKQLEAERTQRETERQQKEAERKAQIDLEREAVERTVGAMREAVQSLHSERKAMLAEMEQAVTELAVAIASRLLYLKISAGDFAVESLVRDVVERLDSAEQVTVKLNPEDLALLHKRLDERQSVLDSDNHAQLVADPSLERGDCVASSGELSVSSWMKDRLAEIRDDLSESE